MSGPGPLITVIDNSALLPPVSGNSIQINLTQGDQSSIFPSTDQQMFFIINR
jgi:hypothetical protein